MASMAKLANRSVRFMAIIGLLPLLGGCAIPLDSDIENPFVGTWDIEITNVEKGTTELGTFTFHPREIYLGFPVPLIFPTIPIVGVRQIAEIELPSGIRAEALYRFEGATCIIESSIRSSDYRRGELDVELSINEQDPNQLDGFGFVLVIGEIDDGNGGPIQATLHGTWVE